MKYKLHDLKHVKIVDTALDIINCILIGGYKDFTSCRTDSKGNVTFYFNAAGEMKHVFGLTRKCKFTEESAGTCFGVNTNINSNIELTFYGILPNEKNIIFVIEKSQMNFSFTI